MSPEEFKGAMKYYSSINPKSPEWSRQVLEFWYKHLGHLEKADLKKSMDRLIIKPFWPSLGQILEDLGDELKPQHTANLIAGNILAALNRYGSSQLDKVEAMVGVDGWEVVRLSGGWLQICEIKNSDITNSKAQWRMLAESVLARSEQEKKSLTALPEGKPANKFLEDVP